MTRPLLRSQSSIVFGAVLFSHSCSVIGYAFISLGRRSTNSYAEGTRSPPTVSALAIQTHQAGPSGL